jgi:hypothetical protein
LTNDQVLLPPCLPAGRWEKDEKRAPNLTIYPRMRAVEILKRVKFPRLPVDIYMEKECPVI